MPFGLDKLIAALSTRIRTFLKTEISFSVFKKNTRPHVFKSYSPVHANTLKPGKYASSLYRACAVTNMTSSYSKTFVSPVHTNTINLRFQKSPLWRAFSKTSDRKRRIHMDGRLKRRNKSPFSKISGYVWTGPELPRARYVAKDTYQTGLDNKSGYDHILLMKESRAFFGIEWGGWYFVYSSLPFSKKISSYV